MCCPKIFTKTQLTKGPLRPDSDPTLAWHSVSVAGPRGPRGAVRPRPDRKRVANGIVPVSFLLLIFVLAYSTPNHEEETKDTFPDSYSYLLPAT